MPLPSLRPMVMELKPFCRAVRSLAVRFKAPATLAVGAIAIFWLLFVGCSTSVLVPDTGPLKSIPLAARVKGLLPAAKLEPNVRLPLPELKITPPVRATGLLKLTLLLLVVILPARLTAPTPV